MTDPISAGLLLGTSALPSILSAIDRRFKTKDIRSKEQKSLDKARGATAKTALDRLQQELAGLDMSTFKDRRRKMFEQQVAPQLRESFSRSSGLKASDYFNALTSATVQNEAQAEQDFYSQLNNLLGLGAGQDISQGKVPVSTAPQALAEGLSPLAEGIPNYLAFQGLSGSINQPSKPSSQVTQQR